MNNIIKIKPAKYIPVRKQGKSITPSNLKQKAQLLSNKPDEAKLPPRAA